MLKNTFECIQRRDLMSEQFVVRAQGTDYKFSESNTLPIPELKKKILRQAKGKGTSMKLFYNGKEMIDSLKLGSFLKQNDLVIIGMFKK